MKPKVPVSRTVFSIIAVLNCAAVAVAENRFSLVAPGAPLPRVVAGSHAMEQDAAVDLCRYLSRISGRNITVSDKASSGKITIHVGRDRFVEKHVRKKLVSGIKERIRGDRNDLFFAYQVATAS